MQVTPGERFPPLFEVETSKLNFPGVGTPRTTYPSGAGTPVAIAERHQDYPLRATNAGGETKDIAPRKTRWGIRSLSAMSRRRGFGERSYAMNRDARRHTRGHSRSNRSGRGRNHSSGRHRPCTTWPIISPTGSQKLSWRAPGATYAATLTAAAVRIQFDLFDRVLVPDSLTVENFPSSLVNCNRAPNLLRFFRSLR